MSKFPGTIIPDNVEVVGLDDNNLLNESGMATFSIQHEIDMEPVFGSETESSLPAVLVLRIASRLPNTNDGFVGVRAVPITLRDLRKGGAIKFRKLVALDAGVEKNTQMCSDIMYRVY